MGIFVLDYFKGEDMGGGDSVILVLFNAVFLGHLGSDPSGNTLLRLGGQTCHNLVRGLLQGADFLLERKGIIF